MTTTIVNLHMFAAFIEDKDEDGARDDAVGSCDCDSADPTLWEPPGLPGELTLSHDLTTGTTTLQWSEPAEPGGVDGTVRYDAIRSAEHGDVATPLDFEGPGAACVAIDMRGTVAMDSDTPGVGKIFFYFIRAENNCPVDPMCRSVGSQPSALLCELPL